jgi:hypothetical protein
VFLVYEYAGATDTYPTEDEFGASVSENCVPAFAGYTGSDFEQQQSLDIYWLFPVADGWEGGDHELVCSLFRVDEQPLTKSMKGANPS